MKRTTLIIQVSRTSGALLRVVSLFHRLALELDSLSFRPVRKANGYSLRIALLLDSSSLPRIEAHLLKIVEVQSVAVREGRNGKTVKPEVVQQTMR